MAISDIGRHTAESEDQSLSSRRWFPHKSSLLSNEYPDSSFPELNGVAIVGGDRF